jgi:hypothetical protein
MRHTRDCPDSYYHIVTVVTAEETTLVDALSSGELDHDDVEAFLSYADEHNVDPGLVHLVKIVDGLLEDHSG